MKKGRQGVLDKGQETSYLDRPIEIKRSTGEVLNDRCDMSVNYDRWGSWCTEGIVLWVVEFSRAIHADRTCLSPDIRSLDRWVVSSSYSLSMKKRLCFLDFTAKIRNFILYNLV